jgi:hypothetical protein
LHTTRDFLVPGRLNGFVCTFKTVEQGVGQSCALVNRERECPFQ